MDRIKIKATETSPEVDFDFQAHRFSLRGMSFMEDVNSFYETLIAGLDDYLAEVSGADIQFDFALAYFNSSSARVVFRLFQKLDAAAANGNSARIRWHAEDDEDIAEEGAELAEDLEHATFELVEDA